MNQIYFESSFQKVLANLLAKRRSGREPEARVTNCALAKSKFVKKGGKGESQAITRNIGKDG